MEVLSVSTHRGLVHWQGLLLVVSLLTFWSPQTTTAKISVVSTYTEERRDVVLHMLNKPPEVNGIVWYKANGVNGNSVVAFFRLGERGEFLSGPGEHGLKMIHDDGSLLLKNVTTGHTGMYTVVVHLPDSQRDRASGHLTVYALLKGPVLRASRNWVREDKDSVVLTCHTNGLGIRWVFRGIFQEFKNTSRTHLSEDRKRLYIYPVQSEDAGAYMCVSWNPFRTNQSHPLELHVLPE